VGQRRRISTRSRGAYIREFCARAQTRRQGVSSPLEPWCQSLAKIRENPGWRSMDAALAAKTAAESGMKVIEQHLFIGAARHGLHVGLREALNATDLPAPRTPSMKTIGHLLSWILSAAIVARAEDKPLRVALFMTTAALAKACRAVLAQLDQADGIHRHQTQWPANRRRDAQE